MNEQEKSMQIVMNAAMVELEPRLTLGLADLLRADNARLRAVLENCANVISLGIVNNQWPSESTDDQDNNEEANSVLADARAALAGVIT